MMCCFVFSKRKKSSFRPTQIAIASLAGGRSNPWDKALTCQRVAKKSTIWCLVAVW